MPNNKYEFVSTDTKNVGGKTLTRIRALKSFGKVKEGDLGGYLESESNLDDRGSCWVGGNACVYEYARILDDAQVLENAQVYNKADISGRAIISKNAKVFENASVSDEASVYGQALVFGYAKVFGKARISGYAKVYEYALVYGESFLQGNASVYGMAIVYGSANLSDNAKVYGTASISGKVHVFNNAEVFGKAYFKDKESINGTMKVDGTESKQSNESGLRKQVSVVNSIIEGLTSKKNLLVNEGINISFKGMKLYHVAEYDKFPVDSSDIGSEVYKFVSSDKSMYEGLLEKQKLYMGNHHIWKLDGKLVIDTNTGFSIYKGKVKSPFGGK
jgi:NDP-sugar pyrophosphorylase family protein